MSTSMALADPRKIAEFSRMVEGGGLESSLRAFVGSLRLGTDEQGEMVRSVQALPHTRLDPSALPGEIPGLLKDHEGWWL